MRNDIDDVFDLHVSIKGIIEVQGRWPRLRIVEKPQVPHDRIW
jgi:hypothetical protein